MAAPSVTHTFSNATTADASEVNTNFNDIINALTDGTSDFTIGAITAAGTATLNGAVTLGNATSDDVTINGYIASDIIPKTSAANDLGSSSLAWQAVYLDNGATDGGAIYFDAGTTKFIKSNAAGTDLSLGGFSDFDLSGTRIKQFRLYNVAKNVDYSILDTDGVSAVFVTVGSSTDKTITLPTAGDNDGRVLTIKKIDSGTKFCIVDGEGSETIDDETSITLYSQYDSITVISDLNEWHIIDKKISNRWEKVILGADESSTGDQTQITFSNLVVGKQYRFYIQVFGTWNTNASQLKILNNSVILANSRVDLTGDLTVSVEAIFQAAATTALFVSNLGSGAIVRGNTSTSETFATLEELNNHTDETTLF